MTPQEREILAKTIMAEAGGEGYLGMLAAGAVMDNRRKAGGYGDGFEGVIMKPGQFSAWNGVTGYAGGEGGLNMAGMRPSEDAYRAADAILSGQYSDPTGGATHYYNPSVANPKWGTRSGGEWTKIGNHIFGFADAGRGGSPSVREHSGAAPAMPLGTGGGGADSGMAAQSPLAQPEMTFADKIKGMFDGTYKPDTSALSQNIASAFAPPQAQMMPAQFQPSQGYQAPDRISKLYAMLQGVRGVQ
jgi:hypothetical protein